MPLPGIVEFIVKPKTTTKKPKNLYSKINGECFANIVSSLTIMLARPSCSGIKQSLNLSPAANALCGPG